MNNNNSDALFSWRQTDSFIFVDAIGWICTDDRKQKFQN